MSDWMSGTCPRHQECTFFQNVASSPLLRVKYASAHPYCKGGKHESCMRWWVMEQGEPVAEDLLPYGGRDVFTRETKTNNARPEGRILVVDDLPMFRKSLGVLASNACNYKCPVLEVESAEEALEHLRNSPADWTLLVTDFHMSGLNGYELIVQMRAHPGLASVPAIVFSSEQDGAVKDRCAALPMVRWLDKRPDQQVFNKAWEELVVGHKA